MHIDMYNKFLKYTRDPYLKKYFIDTFKRKIQTIDINPVQKNSPAKTVNKRKKYIPIKIKNNPDQNIITVSTNDFSFHYTLAGSPRLVYKDSECFFMGRLEWFKPEVLELIDRDFKIKLRDSIGFSFVPIEDKQVFENLLREKYNSLKEKHEKYLEQQYKNQLEYYFNIINQYISRKTNEFIKQYQSFNIGIPLNEFTLKKDIDTYIINIDCFNYIDMESNNKIISIPYISLINSINSKISAKFSSEIIAKWGNGYIRQLEIQDILPNFNSSLAEIKIPAIFVERYVKNGIVKLNLKYSIRDGIYIGSLAEPDYINRYKNDLLSISFPDETKTALKEIFSNIDSPFLITFYTSYVRMFREDIRGIKGIFRTQLKKLEEYDEMQGYPYIPESTRYDSGYCSLIKFDPSVPNAWMWLTDLLKKGISKEAYMFTDSNSTFSSKYGLTKNYPVKVYLSVEEVSGYYHHILDSNTHCNISMYSLDISKSIYRFIVIREKLNEAIFFLWSYFSSNNYNKREDFYKILEYKKHFGIIYFYKHLPLIYKPGLGFCGNNWIQI